MNGRWTPVAASAFRCPTAVAVEVMRYARVHRAATGAVTDAELEQLVRGRAVFVGSSAFSGYSVATTRGLVSGTEVQALAYAHLKAGTVLQPAGPALAALVLGLSLLPSVLGVRQRTPVLREPVLLTLGMAACLLALACAASAWWQQELPLATASTVLAVALLLTAFVHARWVQNNQRRLALERAVAEAANRAKGEFLAIVSHEIRTPINAVMGIGELLAETPLNEEQRSHLAVLRRAGDNLSALINDLLDLARIDAGRLELDPAPFELRPVLDQQLAVVFVGAISKGLQLHLDVAPDVPKCVMGDRKRLAQALLNLLGNAVKFTQQGSVTLAVRRAPGRSEVLRFQVRDTGMGIAPERCESIFEPFTQADGSVTRNHGGSGLGLTITRRLVNLMGGEIELVSALGEGSIFTFTASLPPSSMPPPETPPVPPQAPTGLRILLAEDQAANAYLLQAMLRPGGHTIDVAANGQVAVQHWRERPYDVVLMDLQMPVLDGLGATREIRPGRSGRGPAPHTHHRDQRTRLRNRCAAFTGHRLRCPPQQAGGQVGPAGCPRAPRATPGGCGSATSPAGSGDRARTRTRPGPTGCRTRLRSAGRPAPHGRRPGGFHHRAGTGHAVPGRLARATGAAAAGLRCHRGARHQGCVHDDGRGLTGPGRACAGDRSAFGADSGTDPCPAGGAAAGPEHHARGGGTRAEGRDTARVIHRHGMRRRAAAGYTRQLQHHA
jgi:signal transduction histidine kinase